MGASRGKPKVEMGDFFLSESAQKFAVARGWDAVKMAEEFEAFRDYHLANASRFADWDAAWRTWVRNAVKFAQPRGRPTPPTPLRKTSGWTPEEVADWQRRYRALGRQYREKRGQ